MIKVYFADVFGVSKKTIEEYGAFNISLVNDLPLFIDPFLLFNSKKAEYQDLHNEIINYVQFLREKSQCGVINEGALQSWFYFPEVKQTWFGYSKQGNKGSGLGKKFAKSLNKNLNTIFSNFGDETLTQGFHLEKLCLIKDGIGKDKISDFTTNLILDYILSYTEKFSANNIDDKYIFDVFVDKVKFNYDTETWVPKKFSLPHYNGDYVLLCPKDILTKDENWISHADLVNDFSGIVRALSNAELRHNINNYLEKMLPVDPKHGEYSKIVTKAINKYPEVIDHYISIKEKNGKAATSASMLKVGDTENRYVLQMGFLVQSLYDNSKFYAYSASSRASIRDRINELKRVIEEKEGWEFFFVNNAPVTREDDLKLLLLITWCTPGGGGAVDKDSYKVIKDDVEFKLATNPQLEHNLIKLKDDYADGKHVAIRVIIYFTDNGYDRVDTILKKHDLKKNNMIVLIDATGT